MSKIGTHGETEAETQGDRPEANITGKKRRRAEAQPMGRSGEDLRGVGGGQRGREEADCWQSSLAVGALPGRTE